jgi:hypothetical protein
LYPPGGGVVVGGNAASHSDAPSTGAGTDALSAAVIPGEELSLLGWSAS